MTAVGTDGSRVRLWFEDGSKLVVSTGLVGDFGLYAGLDLDEEDLSRLQEAAQRASAKSRAVRIVSSAAVSRKELEQRLVRKGERPDDAREAADWLENIGAVNDEAMARRIVERCIAKGYGKNRIRQELVQKGIPREFRDAALEDLPDLSDGVDQFLDKKLRGTLPDRKELKRVTDALARRGFSWSEISAGIRRYQDRQEEYSDYGDAFSDDFDDFSSDFSGIDSDSYSQDY